MNRGVLESSPVQQLMATGNPNWWSVTGGMKPPPPLMGYQPPPAVLPSPTSSSPSVPNHNPNISFSSDCYDILPESWSLNQLLLGGLMTGEEERLEMSNHHSFQGKKLENWEDQVCMAVDVKQENSNSNSNNNNNSSSNNGYVMSPNSTPKDNNNNNCKSCVSANTKTSLNSSGSSSSNNNSNMLGFSSNQFSESRSSETGGSANKKPRLQASSPSTQSTPKVRKEKLGGRIAALHQLVSPFGKTDTASVLSEAIGYIRFLQSQIEALSLPYFGTSSGSMRQGQQHVQVDGDCLFPEYPGQRGGVSSSSDSKSQDNNKEDPKKDLRSRGLCLVPISSTRPAGDNDNAGADYWSPAFGAGFR